MNKTLTILLLALCITLSACRGGGGGGSTHTPPVSNPGPPEDDDGAEEEPVAVLPVGRLEQGSANGPITYTTDEAWLIRVDSGTLTVTAPATLSLSGEHAYSSENQHEKLGSRHIKDWDGDVRSLLLPGGAKLTLHADGDEGTMTSINIYDGDESHQIDARTNVVVFSSTEAAVAAEREAAEPDGETAHLMALPPAPFAPTVDYRIVSLYFENVYVEDAAEDGTPLSKIFRIQPLGRIFDANNIDDFHDDERLDET